MIYEEKNSILYGLVTNSDSVLSVDPQVILDSLQIASIFDGKYGYKRVQGDAMMDEVLYNAKRSSRNQTVKCECVSPERGA